MKKRIGWIALLAVAALGWTVLAQADLSAFPIGTTTMVYELMAEDMSEPQTLELIVTARDDERYTVKMVTESTGTEDELGGFGFIFGATSVAYGGEHDVSYSPLQALIGQRDRLQEGQEYLLPGGAEYTNIVGVTIAGVWCLEGTLTNPEEPEQTMTVAFGLSHPVFISPRVVAVETVDGVTTELFRLELIEYTFVEGEG
jgi:hypothetical protein